MQKCKNGHLYDPERTTFCPECPVDGLDLSHFSGPGARKGPQPNPQPNAPPRMQSPPQQSSPRQGRKTIAYYPGISEPAPGRPEGRISPVVGWLVAHKGPALGRDFRIRMGRNTIGAGADQRISVPEDPSMHGQDHAAIVYDSRDNDFYIVPGSKEMLTYRNGKKVLEAQQLEPYDVIEMGTSEFVFVPLCTELFVWDFKRDERGQAS